jgi:hypothetical protein
MQHTTKKILYILLSMLIVLIFSLLVFNSLFFTKAKSNEIKKEINKNTIIEKNCANAGESGYNYRYIKEKECCDGLKEISNCLKYNPNNEYSDKNGCVRIEGCSNICSDCGNGLCESWENYCNCQKDCAKCLNEGDYIMHNKNSNKPKGQCCPGLSEIKANNPSLENYDSNGLKIAGICTSKCGNHECDAKESKYNCPKDCK